MNFASQFSSKDDMLKQKPVGMDSDTWEEVCVVYDLCSQHGTKDSRLIQNLLVRHFEGGEETSGHDTSSMANQQDEVIEYGDTTNPMMHSSLSLKSLVLPPPSWKRRCILWNMKIRSGMKPGFIVV